MTDQSIALLERVIYTLESVQLPATLEGFNTMQKLVGCSEAVRQVVRECRSTREAIRQAAKAADDTDEAAEQAQEAENG